MKRKENKSPISQDLRGNSVKSLVLEDGWLESGALSRMNIALDTACRFFSTAGGGDGVEAVSLVSMM